MARMKLVLVGNGMAGMRTLEELLKAAPDLYDITVFGDEPHPNYNRIMLSPVLAGEQTVEQIVLNSRDWYAEHGITLHTGKRVVKIDRKHRYCRSRRRHTRKLRPPVAGHRLEVIHPAGARRRPARRDRLPRHRRCRRDDFRFRPIQTCGGDRRRPARPGSGEWLEAARHGSLGGAYRALAAGTTDG
jgi:hypothetical protein